MALHSRGLPSKFFLGVCLAGALTACSFDMLGGGGGPKASATPPALSATSRPSEENVVIGAPASDMDTIRALLPSEGLRVTPLFNEKMSSADDRLRRLETVVQSMRNDLDTVVPAIARMAAIERDNKAIEVQQQALAATIAPPVPAKPAPAPAAAPVVAPPAAPVPAASTSAPVVLAVTPSAAPVVSPAPISEAKELPPAAVTQAQSPAPPLPDLLVMQDQVPSGVVAEKKDQTPPPPAPPPPQEPAQTMGDVKALRFSDHTDMTRIVLDMTAEYKGAAKLDNNGKRLVVPLAGLNWTGQKSVDVDSAELISGYHVADGNLYVDLMYPAKIKERKVFLPSKENVAYRAVIDLFSADVHKK